MKLVIKAVLLSSLFIITAQDIPQRKSCNCPCNKNADNKSNPLVGRKPGEDFDGKSSCNICERKKELLRMERERQRQLQKCPFEIVGAPAMKGKTSEEIFDEFREIVAPSQNSFFDMMRDVVKTMHVSSVAELKWAKEKEAKELAKKKKQEAEERAKKLQETRYNENEMVSLQNPVNPKVTVVLKQTPCGQIIAPTKDVKSDTTKRHDEHFKPSKESSSVFPSVIPNTLSFIKKLTKGISTQPRKILKEETPCTQAEPLLFVQTIPTEDSKTSTKGVPYTENVKPESIILIKTNDLVSEPSTEGVQYTENVKSEPVFLLKTRDLVSKPTEDVPESIKSDLIDTNELSKISTEGNTYTEDITMSEDTTTTQNDKLETIKKLTKEINEELSSLFKENTPPTQSIKPETLPLIKQLTKEINNELSQISMEDIPLLQSIDFQGTDQPVGDSRENHLYSDILEQLVSYDVPSSTPATPIDYTPGDESNFIESTTDSPFVKFVSDEEVKAQLKNSDMGLKIVPMSYEGDGKST